MLSLGGKTNTSEKKKTLLKSPKLQLTNWIFKNVKYLDLAHLNYVSWLIFNLFKLSFCVFYHLFLLHNTKCIKLFCIICNIMNSEQCYLNSSYFIYYDTHIINNTCNFKAFNTLWNLLKLTNWPTDWHYHESKTSSFRLEEEYADTHTVNVKTRFSCTVSSSVQLLMWTRSTGI